MPIVTPNWNLPTPALTDAYNLVGDLATFSSAVDGAITSVANARKGTAAQRIAAAAATSDGVLWQDTDGIKMLWRRDSTVAGNWTPAVTRWTGTTAQMNAFTQAPNGFEWFDTSTSMSNERVSGAWVAAQLIQHGRTATVSGSAGNLSGWYYGTKQTISFPKAYPGGTVPTVLANPTMGDQIHICTITGVTNTKFDVVVLRLGAAPLAGHVSWEARP